MGPARDVENLYFREKFWSLIRKFWSFQTQHGLALILQPMEYNEKDVFPVSVFTVKSVNSLP